MKSVCVPKKLLLAGALAMHCAIGLYLPGFSPVAYDEGAKVELSVNKLTSAKTQIPYAYYHLPFCKPNVRLQADSSFGQSLMGDRVENSPYDLRVRVDENCKFLCKMELTEPRKARLRNRIKQEYAVNMIVDNLPGTTTYFLNETESKAFNEGWQVGYAYHGHYYLHNHVAINIQYHSNKEKYDGYRIVGFSVAPLSMVAGTREDKTQPSGVEALCQRGADVTPFDVDDHKELVYTYDVTWTYSDVRWASRWDVYLTMNRESAKVHWFSILNSLLIVVALSGIIAMIFLRTLHRDILNYRELATKEEALEETGWKLVHGDVFRKPPHSSLLSISVGTGVQVLCMCVVTLVFALVGLISPLRRGGLLQCMMLLYTCMGIFAGYTMARLFKVFNNEVTRWKQITALTAFLYPGICFVVFFVLNFCIWVKGSSGAVPMNTLAALVVLWFGVSAPLVMLGANAGFRKEAIELPVKVCVIPRHVPMQPWYSNKLLICTCSGVVPFGAVFTELVFIMSSIWNHQFYYLFGFLFLVLVILVVMSAQVSLGVVYFALTSEDYRWWWASFFASGSSGLWLFLYSFHFYAFRLEIVGLLPMLMYFSYMGLGSIMLGLLTGSVGTLSSLVFVRAIYGSIKVD
eukprot:TRINITY_DN70049_c0_g1_i1.p1 TRINITY_DN70049_c0_g1~~TRINITY_DN70049_c0_g1_i1.p1  ORF type:complete len:631 (-),score=81.81 TRINITY_DN70049_c0_g1_i1:85-1977(-)